MYSREMHPFEPVIDKNSKILILGSFPSVKSRETGFYYGHPTNRFWRVTAAVLSQNVPFTNAEKRDFLLNNGIALWDVARECDIENSADASMKKVVPNDIKGLIAGSKIKKIFCNGKTAAELYRKLIGSDLETEAVTLPSTSAANAGTSFERLIEKWKIIREYL